MTNLLIVLALLTLAYLIVALKAKRCPPNLRADCARYDHR